MVNFGMSWSCQEPEIGSSWRAQIYWNWPGTRSLELLGDQMHWSCDGPDVPGCRATLTEGNDFCEAATKEVAGLGYSASAIFTFWDNQPLGDSEGWSRDIQLLGYSASRMFNFWDVQPLQCSESGIFSFCDIRLLGYSGLVP